MYSKKYIEQLKLLHFDRSRPKGFGGKIKSLGRFTEFLNTWNPSTVLDYGCGKGVILAHLRDTYPKIKFYGYDPALPMFEKVPGKSFSCLFSNDVLEHVEPEHIGNVLTHINQLANKFIWLRIDTLPARKKLSDGRNAHLILENPDWWLDQIYTYVGGKIVYNELTSKGKFDVAIEK